MLSVQRQSIQPIKVTYAHLYRLKYSSGIIIENWHFDIRLRILKDHHDGVKCFRKKDILMKSDLNEVLDFF